MLIDLESKINDLEQLTKGLLNPGEGRYHFSLGVLHCFRIDQINQSKYDLFDIHSWVKSLVTF